MNRAKHKQKVVHFEFLTDFFFTKNVIVLKSQVSIGFYLMENVLLSSPAKHSPADL